MVPNDRPGSNDRPAPGEGGTQPQYTPPNPEAVPKPQEAYRDHPLSSPATGLLGLLIARYGKPGEAIPETYGEAFDSLTAHGTGLFGTTD